MDRRKSCYYNGVRRLLAPHRGPSALGWMTRIVRGSLGSRLGKGRRTGYATNHRCRHPFDATAICIETYLRTQRHLTSLPVEEMASQIEPHVSACDTLGTGGRPIQRDRHHVRAFKNGLAHAVFGLSALVPHSTTFIGTILASTELHDGRLSDATQP